MEKIKSIWKNLETLLGILFSQERPYVLVQIAIQNSPARSQGDYRDATASHEADKQTNRLISLR